MQTGRTPNTRQLVASELEDDLEHLVNASLKPATRVLYNRTWHNFIDFLNSLQHPTKLSIDNKIVALYISHLWRAKMKPSTIRTYVPVISYFHKINSVPDNTDTFFVKQVIKGTNRTNKSLKRKLLTLSYRILLQVIDVIHYLFSAQYDQILFKALE